MAPRRTTTEFNPSEMVQYLRYYLSMGQHEKNIKKTHVWAADFDHVMFRICPTKFWWPNLDFGDPILTYFHHPFAPGSPSDFEKKKAPPALSTPPTLELRAERRPQKGSVFCRGPRSSRVQVDLDLVAWIHFIRWKGGWRSLETREKTLQVKFHVSYISGKQPHSYGKLWFIIDFPLKMVIFHKNHHFWWEKLTISIAIFHSSLYVYQAGYLSEDLQLIFDPDPCSPQTARIKILSFYEKSFQVFPKDFHIFPSDMDQGNETGPSKRIRKRPQEVRSQTRRPWKHPTKLRSVFGQNHILNLPSGYVKIAIENHHF